MPKPLSIKAPAKINLCLTVTHKRSDGYHELNTLFEAVALYDTLELESAESGIGIHCEPSSVPAGPENLAWKAAELLMKRCRVRSGVRMVLKKNIPVGAGLGGGSSDAAAALLGLNQLWKLKLTQKRLLNYAAELGSDVPFFILQTPYAIGKGRGEKLTPVACKTKLWHVLVTPPFQMLTSRVYAAFTSDLLKIQGVDAKMLAAAVRKTDYEKIRKLMFNSLEYAAIKRYPEILAVGEELVKAGAKAAMVSGSGSTVFGLVRSKKSAENVAEKMREVYPKAQVEAVPTAL